MSFDPILPKILINWESGLVFLFSLWKKQNNRIGTHKQFLSTFLTAVVEFPNKDNLHVWCRQFVLFRNDLMLLLSAKISGFTLDYKFLLHGLIIGKSTLLARIDDPGYDESGKRLARV